jgi:type I restriction enzyme R subunit
VLEYFDATLIGLTATPSKQTFGFFNANLVMDYGHEKAVADGVNVNYDVYRIKTAITENGSTVDAGWWVDKRDRKTRKKRWEQLDDALSYEASQLDRDVVAVDQIRTVLTAFRDRLFVDLFPGRADVPKTLIFAKDDAHADDIVQICRDVFGKGNDFCKKITYKTTGETAKDLIARFRNSYHPRIAVTVDMIATGTDIKPLEIVFFMRSVKSLGFFEQMKGRGVRVISETEMEQVNPGVRRKTRFVIVDAVGVTERDKSDSRPLDKKPYVPFEKLLQAVALGNREPAALESLAGRLLRLEARFDEALAAEVTQTAGGQTLSQIAANLLDAIDPDLCMAAIREEKGAYHEPSEAEIKRTLEDRADGAALPLAANAPLRTNDTASTTIQSFRDYLEQNREEIDALRISYARPYRKRLSEAMLKELEGKLRQNRANWTAIQSMVWGSSHAE